MSKFPLVPCILHLKTEVLCTLHGCIPCIYSVSGLDIKLVPTKSLFTEHLIFSILYALYQIP